MKLGIDLVLIDRFRSIKQGFEKRFCHPSEIDYLHKLTSEEIRVSYLASLWAIKEALFKADNKFFDFSKIKIVKEKSGVWTFEDWKISTSHEGNMLIAIVALEEV
ncbi:4'-phosphopantetheinyl transferase superfamily protein [Mycoplasma sp. ES3157-GEN-MYC]|uniref:4'-phosphopantetheinyl transferase superfamily protein n=1 Tax=Mycoplasma miroungigenitalium TaxID=754515 RepID=A0A6M4JBI9_9MOLU|nr:4'-phosphopantetheinyl transferase superfamily protein [Mycoplasma miroungigenitalium]MBU4690367.1 4'-phosphopantetheinyl transferase superfamily protein [Mycoplasma miroungigenitalium]MBU4691634.1 4'-phosphopantetheinyl transferase superfamily protein [Mycoplasma miroungigenitalium]QJR43459.1 4'-phosphopantetheinyl transferase superfamily protein [Mycoplasma miroungigenitalium]